jgi:hypothetical protein
VKSVIRRISTGLGILIIGTAIALTASSPAHATVDQCKGYLEDRGYSVGDGVHNACTIGWAGGATAQRKCRTLLIGLGVESNHATSACALADD